MVEFTEAGLQEQLHNISQQRSKYLTRFLALFNSAWLESNVLFHALLFFTSLMVIVAIFAQLRSLKLFAFHPVFMTIGALVFLAEGITTYRNPTLLEVFSPIMQHGKKVKVRVIHQSLQIIGSFFIGMGLLFMFANKGFEKKTILPHTLHSLVGTVAILFLIVQAVAGSQKMAQLESKVVVKIRRWHGDSGLLLWDLLCLTMLLGLFEFFNFTLTNLFVELCVFATWIVVHVQMRKKGDHLGEEESTLQGQAEQVPESREDI